MLHQLREFEGPVAQAGVLKVDNPDPLAVPEKIGKVCIALPEHRRHPRPASPAAAARISVAVLTDQPSALADGPGQPVQPGRVSRPDYRVVAEVVSLDSQLPDGANKLGLVSCFA